MSRLLWSGAFLFASALAALAGDVAVFIGDSGNSRLARNAQAAVESAGFTVFATTSPRPGEIADMLAVAVERAGAGDRMVVYLGGATALAGTRSYHLGQARRGLNAFTVARMGTDIGIILDQMAEHPGRALLLLRTDRAPIVVGPDQRGIGRLLADVPAGVAAVEGSSSALLGNLMRLFDHPGASVSESFAGQRISGYAPEGLAFLDPADRPMAAGPAPGPSEEDIFFDLARTMGTSAAYRAYIDRYPAGKHVAEANRLIRVLRESPERRAQALEDGLGLSREARRDIQRDLNALGFDTRGIDGIFGKGSRTAIQGWQESRGLEKTGFLSGNQIVTLSSQAEARREDQNRR
ncbi:MAG: peptidoglycan-binding domain-containing protein, partial [Pseudomonadota bacterium]